MRVNASVEDVRARARRRLPRLIFDSLDGAAGSERTLSANTTDLGELRLGQRVGVDVGHRSLVSTMLGAPTAMPVALAPIGICNQLHGDGDLAAARAAEAAGVPFTLSMVSGCTIEAVAQALRAPFWVQLYLLRDRNFVEAYVQRAAAAGCPALMLTIDNAVPGLRHRDERNQLTRHPATVFNRLAMGLHWRWRSQLMQAQHPRGFGNLIGHVAGVGNETEAGAWMRQNLDPSVDWDTIAWLRRRWSGQLVIKGIMDPVDAVRAVNCGAEAIVVSNHGGRQLDGGASTISRLEAIVAAVGTRAEVWLDGGVRCGQDIFRARALGAQGVLIGRAYAYGLAANGETGVRGVLEMLRRELDVTLALCGVPDVRDVARDNVLGWLRYERSVPDRLQIRKAEITDSK